MTLDAPQAFMVWAPRIRLLVNCFLALALGWLLAGLIWLIVEPAGAVSPSVSLQAPVQSASASGAPTANLSVLTRHSRFGRADAPQSLVPEAPTTNLDLILKGVRTASDAPSPERLQQAIAMIEVPGGIVKSVRPGETIIDRVTLNTVLSDRVLILRDGELETLLMVSSADALAVLSLPGQDGLVTGPPRTGNSPSTNPASPTRNTATAAASMAGLDISPVVEEGFTVGYRINAGAAAPILAQAGLSSQDIVTAVNGTPVADIDPDQIMQNLTTSSSVTLTVLRGGASQTLTLSLPNGAP